MKKISIIALTLALSLSSTAVVFAQSYYSGSCVSITRTLTYGSRGSEVSQVQRFLVSRGYPGGGSWMISGRFGPATQTAVRNFQQEMGIALTGIIDSQTRDQINQISCNGGSSYNANNSSTSNNYNYSSPSYSGVPIIQNYNQNYSQNYPQNYQYGNGYNSYNGYNNNYTTPIATIPCTSAYYNSYYPCTNTQNYNTAPVIYTVSPNSGAIGSTVTINGSGFSPIQNTVRIGSLVVNNITSTDGRTLSFVIPAINNSNGYQYNYNTYNTASIQLGAYGLTVTNSAGYSSNTVSFAITGYGINSSPTIVSVNGPASISTGQVGTWTIVINNPTSNYATVSANWGDVSSYTQSNQQQSYSQGQQTITFTHVYNTQGTYIPTFTVTNGNGTPANSSVSVVVYGTSVNTSTPTISSINPGYGTTGTSVTIYGSNFTGSNTIIFNSGAIYNVYTTTGNTLNFVLPSYVSAYCISGQACPTYAQALTPGIYRVSIVNSNGTSNQMSFTVVQ